MRRQFLSPEGKQIATNVVDAAIAVHRVLGPGLLENSYQVFLARDKARSFRSTASHSAVYDGLTVAEGLRLDVLGANSIICQRTSVNQIHPVHLAQRGSHLTLAHKQHGFLLNIHVPLMRHGMKRVAYNFVSLCLRG